MALSARTRRTLPFLLPALVTIWLVRPAIAQNDGWRTIEIETTEVTAPDVAITPDGESLIFTLLGHLFRLPVEGGDAEQLTFRTLLRYPTRCLTQWCTTDKSLFGDAIDGRLTADELLRRYCTLVYAQTSNYQETARRLQLDRRTVKSKIDEGLLAPLKGT